MSDPAPTKVCHVCHKDVSNAKRVKDPAGHYFCQACYEQAAKAAPAGVSAGAKAGAVKATPHVPGSRPVSVKVTTPPPAPPKDEYDFDDPPPAPRPKVTAPVPAPAANSKLPEFCPHCGMKVVGGRKLCVKCKRDVTTSARNHADDSGRAEAVASWVSGLVKVGIWVVVIGFIAFAGYGVKLLLFTKIVPFEEYPTSRMAVVTDFLKFIEKGGDKNYDEALKLVSFRVRHGTNNDNEDVFFKATFSRMHDEFVKRYGEGWLSKAKIKAGGGDEGKDDVDVYYHVVFDKESWSIGVQVQIPVDKALTDRLAHKTESYPENGQWHFGIAELEEFPRHPGGEIKEVMPPSKVWDDKEQ